MICCGGVVAIYFSISSLCSLLLDSVVLSQFGLTMIQKYRRLGSSSKFPLKVKLWFSAMATWNERTKKREQGHVIDVELSSDFEILQSHFLATHFLHVEETQSQGNFHISYSPVDPQLRVYP